jgi:hypothetical protein
MDRKYEAYLDGPFDSSLGSRYGLIGEIYELLCLEKCQSECTLNHRASFLTYRIETLTDDKEVTPCRPENDVGCMQCTVDIKVDGFAR